MNKKQKTKNKKKNVIISKHVEVDWVSFEKKKKKKKHLFI